MRGGYHQGLCTPTVNSNSVESCSDLSECKAGRKAEGEGYQHTRIITNRGQTDRCTDSTCSLINYDTVPQFWSTFVFRIKHSTTLSPIRQFLSASPQRHVKTQHTRQWKCFQMFSQLPTSVIPILSIRGILILEKRLDTDLQFKRCLYSETILVLTLCFSYVQKGLCHWRLFAGCQTTIKPFITVPPANNFTLIVSYHFTCFYLMKTICKTAFGPIREVAKRKVLSDYVLNFCNN